MADGSSSPSSVISMALLHESASIWKRFEALPIVIRQPHRSGEPQNLSHLAAAVAAFYTVAGNCMYRQITRSSSVPC
jgi:hypothetical protein